MVTEKRWQAPASLPLDEAGFLRANVDWRVSNATHAILV
jgi:hypothetical protein